MRDAGIRAMLLYLHYADPTNNDHSKHTRTFADYPRSSRDRTRGDPRNNNRSRHTRTFVDYPRSSRDQTRGNHPTVPTER